MNADEQRQEHHEVAFLERVRRRRPQDVPVLKALADLYTRLGQYRRGLALDLLLAERCPAEPLVWYNLACSHALLGERDAGFAALSRAVGLGYTDARWMREDADLRGLRDDARFERLLQELDRKCHGELSAGEGQPGQV